MAHVLRGSTAELPTTAHSASSSSKKSSMVPTLERKKHSKSPAGSSLAGHKAVLAASARTRPGSCGSTPVHRNRLSTGLSSGAGGKCPVVSHAGGGGAHNPNLFYNMGRGSLPRNPKGKMPLHGRVAGFRQQPVNPVVPSWIEQQQQQQFFQVWPLTRFFFCFLFVKKALICLEGKANQ